MKIQELNPPVNEENRLPFHRSSEKNAPKKSGCYVLTSHSGEILYIGQAENLSRRMKDHLDDGKKKAFWFYWCLEDKIAIGKLEKAWLKHHCEETKKLPVFNKIC